MKNLVRAFVVVLAITGFAASTQLSSTSAQTKTLITKTNQLPVPTCAPSDPAGCHISEW
jgi:hypothetical protein